jgi:hypothetical protein
LPNPVVGSGVRGIAVRGNNVKTARIVSQVGMSQKVMLSSGNNVSLLAPVNTFYRVAPAAGPSITYFDEYYCIGVTHDQIKLAHLAAIVSRQQSHAGIQQKLLGLSLSLIAELLLVGQLAHCTGLSEMTVN